MQTLTVKQKEQYVASGGRTCPYCGTHEVHGGMITLGGDGPNHRIKCGGCEREWRDENELGEITLDKTDARHAS
jgi:hypothetical protein